MQKTLVQTAVSAIISAALATATNRSELYNSLVGQLQDLDVWVLQDVARATRTGRIPVLCDTGIDTLYYIPDDQVSLGHSLWEEHHRPFVGYYGFGPSLTEKEFLIYKLENTTALEWAVYCLWMEIRFHSRSWDRNWE